MKTSHLGDRDFFARIFIALGIAFVFAACPAPTSSPNNDNKNKQDFVAVSEISAVPDTATAGTPLALTGTVLPTNATNQSITWSVANAGTTGAGVSGNTLNTSSAGTAVVTATIANGVAVGTPYTKDFTIIVNAGFVPVTGVTLNQSTLSMIAGGSETLTATVQPSNATNKSVTWGSNNTGIATVSNGTVIAVAPGTATVTVTTADGNKTETCIVTVNPVPVSSVTLNKNSLTLAVGGSETLIATIQPGNATNKSVTWGSSNTSIASVNNGTVTAHSAGTATITVTTADGNKTETCTVTVNAAPVPVSSVILNKNALTMTVGGSETLTATVQPTNATNQTVTWGSSNNDVASVNSGTVTAHSAGTAIITVTTVDSNKTETCTVTVNAASVPVTSVTLNKNTLTLTVGENETLTATVQPNNASNKTVTWGSNNTDVASVSNGTVTAVAPGTATITVTTADGNKTETCTVTVNAGFVPVDSITLNKDTLTVIAGIDETLIATVLPENATNKAFTWGSYNNEVASVNNGIVTGHSAGTVMIYAINEDGISSGGCMVTVIVPVGSVTLDKNSITLTAGGFEMLTATVQPYDAMNKAITWSSNNTGVATVNNGAVTAVAPGIAIITVTTEDGGKTAQCTVTVQKWESFTVTFDLSDAAPEITGPTISRTGNGSPTTATITVDNPGQYSSIEWNIFESGISGIGNSFTLDSANAAYNRIGEHFLTVDVIKDGVPYNKTVVFTVVQ